MTAVNVSVNRNDTPWGDKQIARFKFRVALFIRRGWDEHKAETWADRMAERDYEKDDRRCCIECKNLQQSGACFAAAQGWLLPSIGRRYAPVTDILQRCERFEFVTP